MKEHFSQFKQLLLGASTADDVSSPVWVDMRAYPECSEDEAQLLVRFMEKFDPHLEKKAQIFSSIREFKKFERVAEKVRLNDT